jgi:hypothetical protein
MSEIVEASTYSNKDLLTEAVPEEEERKQSQAWKVVGSPARRASVATLDEKKSLPMFRISSENLNPPPGFKADWQPKPFTMVSIQAYIIVFGRKGFVRIKNFK